MIFQNWQFRTLRVHRINAKGKMPLTHVFDIIRRPDTRMACLIETWGGFNKGYIKNFQNEADMLVYLGKRLNKIVRPASATIGLGKLKDSETEITLEEGHWRIVHDSREFGEHLDLYKDAVMSKAINRERVREHGKTIGYLEEGWNQRNNLANILAIATETKENMILTDVIAAMICRVGLNIESAEDYDKMASSLAEIDEFTFTPDGEPHDEKMFTGEFSKAFAMSANMIRKHKPLEAPDDAPKAVREEVFTEEEKEMMHNEAYSSWGAWS